MDKLKRQLLEALVFGTLVAVIILGLVELQNQTYAQFFEQDPAVSFYNGGGDIDPTLENSAIVIPVSVVIILFYFFKPTILPEDSIRKIKAVKSIILLFGLFTASTSSFIVVNILKKSVGRPRPMALYGCNYLGYKTAVDSGNYTEYYALTTFGRLGDIANCYNKVKVDDMWSSFPSGHASFSFATMVFTHFVLTKLLDIEKDVHHGMLSLLAYSPLVLCTWVGATRLVDQKHHVDDVLAGAAIGTMCAYTAWKTCWALCENVARHYNDVLKSPTTSESELVNMVSRKTQNTDFSNCDESQA